MTQHVRTSYRRHRKSAWGLALALVGAVAVVVIPLATAAGKTYTLTATPSATCASPASTVVTLKNTGSPQTLGSAEIYFPPGKVDSVSSGALFSSTSSPSSAGVKDIVALDNLNLAPNASRSITVTFKPGVTFTAPVTAVAKQANRFNDSGGSANVFTLQGSFPTLRIVTCVTISGRVYQDRNLDNTYTTGSGAFLNSDVPKAWKLDLYTKDGASAYTLLKTVNPSSATDGSYTFTGVPTGSDYKICVTALNGDTSYKWALQSPARNPADDCAPISTGGPRTAANLLPGLSANAIGQDFLVVPVVGPFGTGSSSTVPGSGYTVVASSNSTKLNDFYVQDTWVDAQGRKNFRFSPITTCPPTCPAGKIYLLETLTADITLASLGGKQVVLRYDDAPPFLDADLKPMPYCNVDPRVGQAAGALAETGVLPGTDTSCIVESSQKVMAGGNVNTVYMVYTAYDGGRQIG